MATGLALAFSLGVHLLVFLSLRLVGEGTRPARYRWFVGSVALWISLALASHLGLGGSWTPPAAGATAHLLPLVLFLVVTVQPGQPLRRTSLVLAAAVFALLPFTVDASPLFDRNVERAYYGTAWALVAVLTLRAIPRSGPPALRTRRRLAAAALAGGAVSIGLFVGIGSFAAIALVAAALQAIVLYATVRLSFSAVRAGAARAGALATDAVEQERRAVAGEIAAMVAHEVRNPLTGVRSLAQRLAGDDVPVERRQSYAQLIVREVDRVEEMVSGLLGAFSGRTGTVTEAGLRRTVDDVALLVASRLERAGLMLSIVDESAAAVAPREPFAQILLNLLLNAAAQAPRGSTVEVSLRRSGADAAEIRVADRGPGVTPSERESIFAPFESGTGGSGLGLAVVQRLCAERGWEIRVEDNPDGGAVFVLTIPGACR